MSMAIAKSMQPTTSHIGMWQWLLHQIRFGAQDTNKYTPEAAVANTGKEYKCHLLELIDFFVYQ